MSPLWIIPWLAGAAVIYPETWDDPWWKRLGISLSWPLWASSIGILLLVILPLQRGVKETWKLIS